MSKGLTMSVVLGTDPGVIFRPRWLYYYTVSEIDR